MAWEKLSLSRQNWPRPLIALSIVWIALVITGARLTNFDEPYLPFAVAGALAFFLRGAPSRWEIYAWLLISAFFVKVIHLPQVPFWMLRVAASFAVLGFGALLLLGLRALWSDRDGRENALTLLAPSIILTFFIFGCARVLSVISGISPQTDDAWLFAFDGSLGFQPSFFVGRILYDSTVLTRAALLTYLSLPFAMAVVCAWQVPVAARRISWHMLTVLLCAGIGGWLLYSVVPGTGPIYAFSQLFPWNSLPYKDLSTFALQKVSLPTSIPRNAMPSLHVGWVVLLYWNSRKFPVVLRAAALLYLVLTVMATLGTGQHYLVDLIVSLPFALTVQSLVSYTLPHKSRRLISMATGFGLTMAWLAMVRFGVPLALKSPAIPWMLILATVTLTLWLQAWMSEPFSTRVAAGNAVANSSETAQTPVARPAHI